MSAAADTRHARMSVDLGGEQVLLERARCTETLGGSFALEINLVATLGEIDLMPHLGKPVAVQCTEEDGTHRYFHGLIAEGEFLHERGGRHHYRLLAHPFTFFLSHNIDMAIFQDLSVPDIIKKVIEAAGISDFRLELTGTYPPRDYCVQYRESDLTFITRLMEEEGIYYYWQHTAGAHTMVICDAPSAHKAGHPAALTWNPVGGGGNLMGSLQRIGSKRYLDLFGERVSTGSHGQVTRRSFDFKKPERPLQANFMQAHGHAGGAREVYSYPTTYIDEGRGGTLSTRELASLRHQRQLYRGRTEALGIACGTLVAVKEHTTDRLNHNYLVTRTEHVVQSEVFRSGEHLHIDAEEHGHSHVTFDCIPSTTPFHLPHVTPRPVVNGLESAMVSGPDGEEIYTDEYGRVKVRFHWDRGTTTGEHSTCWIRVAQFGGLGNIILPRINQEVMVDFLHGNPDEPIVTGWVFNQAQMPVYALPDHKTRHVWRSKSYPGGKSTMFDDAFNLDTGSPAANEIRFEDKAGREEVFVHAEKDMNLRTRHDQTNHVAHNQYDKVYWDRDAYVGRDETTTIKRNQTLTINEGDQKETLEKGSRTVTIEKGNDQLDVKSGNITVKAHMGKIIVDAAQSITLKCGESKIVIDPVSITMESLSIKVDAKVQLATSGGAMAEHKAGGMNTIKGGIVMIN